MDNEIIFVLEPDVGRVTVEISQVSHQAAEEVANVLGTRVNLNCAKPANSSRNLPVLTRQSKAARKVTSDESSIWLYRLYHHSTVDGPGRRSVVQVSGCSIRCQGCFVPETHERENGTLILISTIVDEIVTNRAEHDGVTILGGEPFDQPSQVAELVSRLKEKDLHVTVYSGYTMEVLMGKKNSAIDHILTHVDLMIDGPFIAARSGRSGEYRGSGNQRIFNGFGRTIRNAPTDSTGVSE